ncbi:MAG: glycosyltransferase family 2 protein [Anaerolineaceae bacterium]|nr:glycosyltransferase family 2 protein [Anaerolineaceae bacterium]
MDKPLLSIVIPAYNEETRLPLTLGQISTFLDSQAYPAEIIVVENGSRDRTLEIARDFTRQIPYLRVFHEERNGKGLAVRRGMLEAEGEYRFICDADLSMPIEEVNRFIPPALNDADIAIASREAPGAVRYDEPEYRHIVGRVFNTFVRILALPGLQDTQCGFKCFRGDIAEELFPKQTISGWTFDVEVLYIARLREYQIMEIPIPWYFNPHSKVHVVRDSVQMFLDLLKIRFNDMRGHYKGDRHFESFQGSQK